MAEIYKVLLFMKRRPGMSVEDFRDYYETTHVPLVTRGVTGIDRYVRRYIVPLTHAETGVWDDPPYDVITELWIKDEAAFRALTEVMATATMPSHIIEDEEKLFDRSSFRIATVVECDGL